VHKLNSYLPKDIVVYDIIPVPDEAYSFWCDPTNLRVPYQHFQRSVFCKNKVGTFIKSWMSIWWMRRQKLLNHTDFQCFQSEYGRKHFFFQADWKQENSQLVFTISANRFLETWCVPSWNISKHRYSQDYAWWFQ
jgi:tRNA pseudouridine38-40 synthase